MKKILGLFLIAVALSVTLARGADTPPTVDVAGTWNFEVQTSEGAGHPVFTFKQDGEILTGNYKGLLGEAEVRGSVKGNAISFRFSIDRGGGPSTIEYSGTVDGDTMKGKMKFAQYAEGTFTGKKQPK